MKRCCVCKNPSFDDAAKAPLCEVCARLLAEHELSEAEKAATRMLTTPYETLCNLVAEGYLSEDEQSEVQAEFDAVGDATLYGLINAVTRIAGRCRDFDDWKRAVELERLGGGILGGEHQPPVLDAVYH